MNVNVLESGFDNISARQQPALRGGTVQDAVQVERDLPYGQDPKQRLDVYHGAKLADHAPVIIMVHGGAWFIGDKTNKGIVENKVNHWVPRGFVFASVNYRLVPNANPVEQTEDVARAVAYVQAHAAEWGGDPNKVILMGHSAGAHLVDLLSVAPQYARQANVKPWLGTVSLDSAAVDVPLRMGHPHPSFFDNAFGKDANFWKTASPLYQLNAKTCPLLLVCSSLRRDGSCEQNSSFADKAKGLGSRVQTLPVALRHAEINNMLGLESRYTTDVDDFISSLLK